MTQILRSGLLEGVRVEIASPAGEVAELTAYLASPAGAYFSGCRFDLGGV